MTAGSQAITKIGSKLPCLTACAIDKPVTTAATTSTAIESVLYVSLFTVSTTPFEVKRV